MIHLLRGLAANPALPADLLARLVGLAGSDAVSDPSDDLPFALSERTDLTPDQVRTLAAADEIAAIRFARTGLLDTAGMDPLARPEVTLAVLDEGAGPPDWARALAHHPSDWTRWRLASRPGLPLDVLETLAVDPDVEVVGELGIWTTEPELAARLAAHPHAEVRMKTAVNESVPPAALAALITGEGLAPALSCLICDDEDTRADHDQGFGGTCAGGHESTVLHTLERAARNPATPPAAAASLAGHPSVIVRWAVAERTDLPQDLYARLAADPDPAVRKETAGNPALGEPLLRALASDGAPDVRRLLTRHPGIPLDALAELAFSVRLDPERLPRLATATPEELAGLAASPHAALRALAARGRFLPAEVRDALAEDRDASVVRCVASHPGLSEEQLRAMVVRHGVRVLAQVAANPDAPAGLLVELARHDPPVRRALREIAVHPNAPEAALLACMSEPRAATDAALHPALSAAVLADLVARAAEDTAEAAAANPSLPRAVMEELLARCGPAA
ncbi:hypothetical protein [Streptomyces sp. NBC_00096]|uniref:hypothetical protein n=1 Tax=Streptomyces sp. NBC_00096 TaxID=2975650 RepID=UPI0032535AE7